MSDFEDNEERSEPEHGVSYYGGRPPIFKTAEEMQEMISGYFNGGYRTRKVIVGSGDNRRTVEVPMITITGLVLYLGFADRSSFYDYEDKPEFFYTIKKARTFIEQEYEELLQNGLGPAAIFALKNFGWHDKQEIEDSRELLETRQRIKDFLDERNPDGEHIPNNGETALPDDSEEA